MTRRRSMSVTLGITAVVAGLTGCGSGPDPDYAGLCTDAAGNRVDDAQCRCVDPEDGTTIDDDDCRDNTHARSGHWIFLPYGRMAPRVGMPVTGGVTRAPRGHSFVTGGVSASGGKVDSGSVKGGTTFRGGFGSGGKVGG